MTPTTADLTAALIAARMRVSQLEAALADWKELICDPNQDLTGTAAKILCDIITLEVDEQ